MKAVVEDVNSVQKRMKITLPASLVSAAFDKAYGKLRGKAKINGFRPGKAPISVIKKVYGESVAYEVSESLINDNLFHSLNEHEIKPIASPVVETADLPENGKDYEFSAVVDILPDFKIENYENLKATAPSDEVTDEMVDTEVNLLARQQAKTSKLEDESVAAADNHLVTVSHTATLNGEEVADLNVNHAPVAIGRKELFEGLENEIKGMKKGETKETEVELPDTYRDADLRGMKVQFSITVDDIMALEVPEINDEFAKVLNIDSKDELVKRVRENLEKRAKETRQQQIEKQLLDQIRGSNDFDVPPSMVDEVIDSMIREQMRYIGQNDEEQVKAMLKNDDIRKELREEGKTRARNTLILWQLSKQEEIEVTDEDLKAHVTEAYLGNMEDGDKKSEMAENLVKSSGAKIKENLTLEKALDFLIEKSTIEEAPKEA